jgi:DNA-binding beta-propeller fold protein YncE
MPRVWVMIAIAILAAAPVAQSGASIVNIPYGRSWPRSIIVDPGRQLIYVDGVSGEYPPDGFSFGFVSMANQSLGKVVGLPGIAGELALDPSSGTVYAAGDNSVSVFDVQNTTLLRTIVLKIPIFSMAFDSTTGNLLLTSGNTVYQMDPASGRLLRNATVGDSAEGMAVDAASGVVFVANYLSSSVSVLRTADLTLLKTIQLPLPSYPAQLALDSNRGILYASTDEQSVVAVNATSYSVLKSIRVTQSSANGTYTLAVDPVRNRLFVAAEPGTTVTELNPTSGAILATFSVESDTFQMDVDQTTGELYVTNYHQISVITPVEVVPTVQQPSQYETAAILVGVSIAVLAFIYVWRFTSIGGRRGGPAPQQRRDPSS